MLKVGQSAEVFEVLNDQAVAPLPRGYWSIGREGAFTGAIFLIRPGHGRRALLSYMLPEEVKAVGKLTIKKVK